MWETNFTINCFRRWLQDHAQLDDECVAVLAPTGTAAFNVSGRTLHSVLRLPVPLSQATFQKATGPALTALQESFRCVRVVVIDEMSMVGRRMLRALDDRLRQAKMRPHEPFGGLSLFFSAATSDSCPLWLTSRCFRRIARAGPCR